MTRTQSFTEGAILPLMIRYTLPLIFTNLLQVLYTFADNLIVEFSGVPDAVGAIGTTTAFINLAVNIFIGCSIGTKVVVARCIGAGDERKVKEAVHTSIAMSVLLGILCAAVGIFLSRPLLCAMGNRGTLLELAVTYTNIYFLSVPFTAVTNFAIAILGADGDTKTPLYILSLSGLLNVILNLFFVLVCGMNVDGVAIATVISAALSALLLILHLMRTKGVCRLTLKHLSIRPGVLREVLLIGMPAAMQNALFSLSHLLVQSSILTVNNAAVGAQSSFQPIVKGCSVSVSIESIACTAINAIGNAAVPFIAQNNGAGNAERMVKGRRIWYVAVCVTAAALSMLLLLFLDPLLSLYGISTNASDPLIRLAYEAALTRMQVMFIPYFLLGAMEVGGAVLQGLGKAMTASAVSLIGSCLFRVIWLLTIFRIWPTLTVIFLSFPISWLITAAVHFLFASHILKKKLHTT